MSKWNKPAGQELSAEFLENEERRKQMIIEAAKRRKEKERRVLEQEELKRKDEEEALVRHRQEKKDAYVKYLRNNIYDKYEDVKRKKKEESSEIKPTAKWKKRTPEKQEEEAETAQADPQGQLEALDLEVDAQMEQGLISGFSQEKEAGTNTSNARKKLNEQFEKEWQMELSVKEDLLSSKLLDSLDLDVGTLNRDYQMKELIKQKNKADSKQHEKNDDIKELRDLIGYESVVITHQKPSPEEKPKIQPEKQPEKPVKAVVPAGKKEAEARKAEANEVQVLNELKRQKQAKVLNWAIQEELQAEDLFSECSSITRKKQPKALKELNEQLKNKKTAVVVNNKKALETIKEVARQKIASREKKANSNEAPKPIMPIITKDPKQSEKATKRPFQNSRQKQEKPERMNSKSMQKRANATTVSNPTFKKQPSRQEVAKTAISGFPSDKVVPRVRTASKQRKQPQPPKQPEPKQPELKQVPSKPEPPRIVTKPEPPKKAFGNLPPLPVSRTDNNSIATHDMQIDVDSFIKQQLFTLNEKEMELQEELKQLHKATRTEVTGVLAKYGIKTDYRHSSEITGLPREGQQKYYQSEADVEESIENIENYLIRQGIQSRQAAVIREATEQECSESIINPFSTSEMLCNQVLKLAKNIQRFDRKPAVEDPAGYAHLNRMRRNNSGNKVSEVSRITRDSKKEKPREEEEELAESQMVSEMRERQRREGRDEPREASLGNLSRPPFIFDASEMSSKLRTEDRPERIHVNAHLLKGLIDDD